MTCASAHCFNCYNRPLKNTQECDDPAPSNNCDIYTFHVPGCDWCKKGYAVDAQSRQLPCTAQTDIPDCQVAFTLNGATVCGLCQGGFPAADYKSCVPFQGGGGVEKNCAWGGLDQQGNKECFKCQSGFTSVAGGCETQTIDGCMYTGVQSNYCGICDAWNGWFALTDDGKCTKGSSVEGSASSGDSLKKIIEGVRQNILDTVLNF
eukprot:TRINITY_DN63972_c0_g1_i1.p1 TRINITY_DN63972_c0_g1~~TRINITY_DN63972_c0_g1_i1.p1  ORF type:complete len:235 (-),score=16.37 TRINITY_DN63972_c0_g1_i1:80-697(-)